MLQLYYNYVTKFVANAFFYILGKILIKFLTKENGNFFREVGAF